MRNVLKKIKRITLCTLLALVGIGCANKTDDFQGKWADVNSGTKLEIKGNHLTISFGDWSDEYRFKVTTEYEMTYLSNVKGDGSFGIMSNLQVCDDGSLKAYEMILDGESHQYRFVREENLDAEYEVEDLSFDYPKEIQSKEFEEVALYFDNNGGSYGLGESWESGHYSWELTRNDDGTYEMHFLVTRSSYMVINFREEVSAEYAQGFAALIEELGILKNNGYYVKNNESSPSYLLHGTYTSGEKLYIFSQGAPAKNCIFDLGALLDYAAKQNLRYEEEYEEVIVEDADVPVQEETPETDYEEVYGDVLNTCYQILSKEISSEELEEDGYIGIFESTGYLEKEEALASLGYAIKDVSGDGIPELLVGWIDTTDDAGSYGNMLYGVYHCTDGQPRLAFEGWARNSYRWLGDGRVFHTGSGGAAYSIFGTYHLSEDGSELICEDYYFTHEKDETFQEIGAYHNTTGEWDVEKSEEMSISLDEFWEMEEKMAEEVQNFELTPFSKYEMK